MKSGIEASVTSGMEQIKFLLILLCMTLLTFGCTGKRGGTLKSLNDRGLLVNKEKIETVSEMEVMGSYHDYLGDAPANHPMYSNALNRLADLEMKAGDDKLLSGQDEIFQQALQVATSNADEQGQQNYENAIELYTGLLIANPDSARNDWVLYQLASAYEKLGKLEEALEALDRLVTSYPVSEYFLEAQFRRGDIYFLMQDYLRAEQAFKTVYVYGKKSVYYEKSIYKYAWSLFKQEQYEDALDMFFVSLQTLPVVYDLQEKIDTRALSKVEKDMLDDIFRAVNLCISYGGGVKYASQYFDKYTKQPFEYEVFKRMGDYFIEHERIKDAADTYGVFVIRQPFHPMASTLQVSRINAYDAGRFGRSALIAREEFVNRFGVDTAFWKRQNSSTRSLLRSQAKSILNELSEYYHARLQRNRKDQENYSKAVYWYDQYIKTFPGDSAAAGKQFLLGDLYSEKKNYHASAQAYFKAAYDYAEHPFSREAAYSAVDAYNKLLKQVKNEDKPEMRNNLVVSSLRFVEKYPQDKQSLDVRVRLVEELFGLKRYDDALLHAEKVLTIARNKKNTNKTKAQQMAVSVIIGHISFDREDYLKAQSSYQKAINLGIRNKNLNDVVVKRLAASTYKYAELMNKSGNLLAAAEGFMSVKGIGPRSNISAQAQYDAAVAYIKLGNWSEAIQILEKFRFEYPDHKLQTGVTEKLASCYENNGQFSKAANEVLLIGQQSGSQEIFKSATIQAAALYEKGGTRKRAIDTYKSYVRGFNLPMEESLETKLKIVDLYAETGQENKKYFWLKNIASTKLDPISPGGVQPSDRAKYIVSNALVYIANEKRLSYERVALNLPLNKSLKKKKKLMKAALLSYEKITNIGVEEFTTAATFHVAKMYQHLGSSIMKSQRPKNLTPEELEEYGLLLEEQAFPFEEQAISLYELNVRRISQGVYDEWVQKSLSRLATIQPARYEKEEVLNEMYTALE